MKSFSLNTLLFLTGSSACKSICFYHSIVKTFMIQIRKFCATAVKLFKKKLKAFKNWTDG